MEKNVQIALMVIAVGIIAATIGYGFMLDQPASTGGEGGIRQFASAAEVRAYLAAHAPSGGNTYYRGMEGAVVPQAVDGVAEKSSAPSLPTIGGTGGTHD
jgi:hypothetical protein